MASRAVVFRPINADDVSCTPFEANTTFVVNQGDYLKNNYIVRHGIHNNQITPISASNSVADNIKNADGTFQTPTWKALDHMFYNPVTKHQPMNTFEHYNPRYTEKFLHYSCSLITIPYVKHGENIKPQSITFKITGSHAHERFKLYDDKYGNLRDSAIDSASFVKKKDLVGYWGFNDEFRKFELNYGTLGGNFTRGKEIFNIQQSLVNQQYEYASKAYRVGYSGGIKTTQHVTASGIAVDFHSGSRNYIITEHHNNFNFRNDEEFAISFWCNMHKHQPYSSSKVTTNGMITKRGVEREFVRAKKIGKRYTNRQVQWRNTNLLRNRFPFDISITNQKHPTYPAGRVLFSRSDGTTTTELTSSSAITGSWCHVVCQKTGSMMKLYINGKKESTIEDASHYNVASHNVMNISALMFGGVDESKDDRYRISGSLDEIRIYRDKLTDAEVYSLSNNDFYSSSAYQTSVVGNAFYRTGQLVISSPLPKYNYALQSDASTTKNNWRLQYKSARTIYENEVLCKVSMGDCNVTMNPTTRKPKSSLIQNQFTGSGFKPYITTIGLYDDQARLIAIAKLGRPVQKREDVDMNFLIRWDY